MYIVQIFGPRLLAALNNLHTTCICFCNVSILAGTQRRFLSGLTAKKLQVMVTHCYSRAHEFRPYLARNSDHVKLTTLHIVNIIFLEVLKVLHESITFNSICTENPV